jgi:hypothetical protein
MKAHRVFSQCNGILYQLLIHAGQTRQGFCLLTQQATANKSDIKKEQRQNTADALEIIPGNILTLTADKALQSMTWDYNFRHMQLL